MIERGGKGDKVQGRGSPGKGWPNEGGGGGEGGRVHVKDTHEQKLKERSKFNFQTRNQITLCDLKIKT